MCGYNGYDLQYEVEESNNVISVSAKSYRYFLNGQTKLINEKKFDDIEVDEDLREFEYLPVDNEFKRVLESELACKYDKAVNTTNPSITYFHDIAIILLPSNRISFLIKPLFEFYTKKENINMVLVLCEEVLDHDFINISLKLPIRFFSNERSLVEYICESYTKGVI